MEGCSVALAIQVENFFLYGDEKVSQQRLSRVNFSLCDGKCEVGFFMFFKAKQSTTTTKIVNVFTAHNKIAAMKRKLVSWIKKVDCGSLGSFEPLSSFISDKNNRSVVK